MTRTTHTTREGWLNDAVKAMRPMFKAADLPQPPKKLLCATGWPKSAKNTVIGQCFPPVYTDDETTHVFVSPVLNEPVPVLATLLHELVHAAIGCEEGHGSVFKAAVRKLGLAGKATATFAEEGSELHAKLSAMSKELGRYPHSGMKPKVKSKRPPAGGWIKFESKTLEGYILRLSPKAFEAHGAPLDPIGEEMEQCDAV